MSSSPNAPVETPRLKRSLTLWDLILYGIIVIQPTAPMPAYGVFSNEGQGHVVTSILIAMVAMVFTAMSYGRMARVYPSAGSAYTYVGRELHPSLGYVTGWSMTMDYILNPLICTIWCAKAMADLLSGTRFQIPYPGLIWPLFFAALFTALNLRGVQTSARINKTLCAIMGAVILAFFWYTIRYIFHLPQYPEAYFLRPFYNPETFTVNRVFHGTSVAVLTYIGFDGISTLVGRGGKPQAEHFSGDCTGLPDHRVPGLGGGLRRAIVEPAVRLCGERSGERIQSRRSHCRWPAAHQGHQRHVADRHHRFRHGRATRRGPFALRHGPQQRHPQEVLRGHPSEDADPRQQRRFCRRDCVDRSFPASATTMAPNYSTSAR